MPPTHALSRADAPCVRPLRRSWLVRSALYALLFVLLTCLGDQHSLPESPARSATVSSAVTLPAEGSDGETLYPSESPDRCHDPHLGKAVFPQSSPRVPPRALVALSLTDDTATPVRQLPDVVGRPLPSGGRSARTAICRWRI